MTDGDVGALLGDYWRCNGISDLSKRVMTPLRAVYTLAAVSHTSVLFDIHDHVHRLPSIQGKIVEPANSVTQGLCDQ